MNENKRREYHRMILSFEQPEMLWKFVLLYQDEFKNNVFGYSYKIIDNNTVAFWSAREFRDNIVRKMFKLKRDKLHKYGRYNYFIVEGLAA